MTSVNKHKARMRKIRQLRATQHLKPLATLDEQKKCLSGDVDTDFIDNNDVAEAYANRIQVSDLSVPKSEVLALLNSIDSGNPVDNVLEPVFLSLFDGTMRALKIGTKQGITASRLYKECKTFSYDKPSTSVLLDSYTEHLNERDNITDFGKQSHYNSGVISRGDQKLEVRDTDQMDAARDRHFGQYHTANDAYGGAPIYRNKIVGAETQHAEPDHIVPCAEICHNLKQNKALNLEDIKQIANIDDNLAMTSMQNNRGKAFGKFAKSRDKLQQEIDQGAVIDSNGVHTLSEKHKQIRQKMVKSMDKAQREIDAQTNQKVMNNITKDRAVQKRLATDAKNAAANQSIGDMILFLIKPLYFELRDCFINGIEKGVGCHSFKSALAKRFGRMKEHIVQQAGAQLKEGLFNFFKNFLSMLLEGIVNCFVGIFKQVARMIKEGFKILLQIAPVLKDSSKTKAQRGDAILKLIASSLSIFAGIGIEAWLNSLGLGEPWSIIISSVLTAVVTALMLYLLDKIDLFGANQELKSQRIDEVLNLKLEQHKQEIFTSIALLN